VADDQQNETIDAIRAEAHRIIASGVLGRSRFYKALLEYLIDCIERDHVPKEVEIAAEVFRRGSDFDPSQDSMVRVYAHNLRQKLRQYYAGDGADVERPIGIPKGEYRLVLMTRDPETGRAYPDREAPKPAMDWARAARVAGLVIVGAVAGIVLDRFLNPTASPVESAYREVARTPFWSELLDDGRPIVIVVGDYFIFGELDRLGNVDRLVREFSINSSRDLDELIMVEPEYGSRYIDLDLTYLPSSTAFAMREILRVIYTSDQPIRVVSMSDLDAADIRDNNIVYVGYISALDKLIDFVFHSSELAVGNTFDELVNTVTGQSFHSEAGMPTAQRNYRDYGLVSTFPGPSGNQIMIISGTRDEGLMQSAQAVSDPNYVRASLESISEAGWDLNEAFEILYEVAGFDRTNLDAMIVHVAELDYESIWTGDFSLPD
jgi:hypothetical protein